MTVTEDNISSPNLKKIRLRWPTPGENSARPSFWCDFHVWCNSRAISMSLKIRKFSLMELSKAIAVVFMCGGGGVCVFAPGAEVREWCLCSYWGVTFWKCTMQISFPLCFSLLVAFVLKCHILYLPPLWSTFFLLRIFLHLKLEICKALNMHTAS